MLVVGDGIAIRRLKCFDVSSKEVLIKKKAKRDNSSSTTKVMSFLLDFV